MTKPTALPKVEIHRHGTGPTVVLLHCLGVDRRLWDIAAPGLSNAFETLSYDFAGHGAAPVPQSGYSIEDLAEQLAEIFRVQSLEKAHVCGISLGGLVAQRFAAHYPGLVDRLVLVDTTPCYTGEMQAVWRERAATARQRGVGVMIDHLLQVWFTPAFIAANGAAVSYVRKCFEAASGEGYALACEALAAADLRPILGSIAAPTLVVCGREDLPSFIEAAQLLSRQIRDAELLWLAPARHASILERPQDFMAALLPFLNRK
jgi:3-oxoadipate enol-lactonase